MTKKAMPLWQGYLVVEQQKQRRTRGKKVNFRGSSGNYFPNLAKRLPGFLQGCECHG
jgi:hypothetical protein